MPDGCAHNVSKSETKVVIKFERRKATLRKERAQARILFLAQGHASQRHLKVEIVSEVSNWIFDVGESRVSDRSQTAKFGKKGRCVGLFESKCSQVRCNTYKVFNRCDKSF